MTRKGVEKEFHMTMEPCERLKFEIERSIVPARQIIEEGGREHTPIFIFGTADEVHVCGMEAMHVDKAFAYALMRAMVEKERASWYVLVVESWMAAWDGKGEYVGASKMQNRKEALVIGGATRDGAKLTHIYEITRLPGGRRTLAQEPQIMGGDDVAGDALAIFGETMQ